MRGLVAAGTDSAPVELAILDADGTVLAVNGAWRRFADENRGTDPEYWVGENYFAVCERAYAEPRAAEVVDGLRGLLDGSRDRFTLEYPCHSPEEQRWYALDAAGFEFDGEPHVVMAHLDVTDRKRAEMRATAQARTLESVLHAMSHDIRNPLQVIDAHVDLLAADLEDPERLESVRRAVARIAEITEATLAFSNTAALSSVEPLSLGVAASEAWERVEAADARLTIRGSETFHADRNLLAQLFQRLFENAVAYAGPDCRVTVGTLPNGFYVEDDGPGIPADIRREAAERDFSTQGAGGVGLAIVQAVVDAHGGTLVITDAEGGGARFEVTGFDVAP